MAPFLFLVVAEGLAGLVRSTSKENLLRGVKVGRNEIECSMLQFANDTLFMCEDSFSNVFTIQAILRMFELAYGLKVNFHKSKLAGIKVGRSSLETYAGSLNCGLVQVPFKYLGLKVGGNLILPVDQNAGALPRQTWIDVCAVSASVLHRDPPQEPANDETAPLRSIALRRPSQRLNHQLLKSKLKNSKEP